jgi:hypothetical protein
VLNLTLVFFVLSPHDWQGKKVHPRMTPKRNITRSVSLPWCREQSAYEPAAQKTGDGPGGPSPILRVLFMRETTPVWSTWAEGWHDSRGVFVCGQQQNAPATPTAEGNALAG